MDEGFSRYVLGINVNRKACVSSIGPWYLQSLLARWTHDEHRLALAKLVKSLEEMNPPKRNHLRRLAVVTNEGYVLEPRDHGVILCPMLDG